jgi:hypothetical protein
MTTLLICSLSTAFILTAVEELIFPLNKLRGLFATLVAVGASYIMGVAGLELIPYTLASAFAGLVMALVVESTLTTKADLNRIMRELPRRVPPL